MMQVPTPCPTCLPGSPVSNVTSFPAAVVADTIVRTVELGVTITDAAVDRDVTVVFCNLLDDGQRHCPGCGGEGVYRDTVIRKVTDVPVVGHPLRLRVRVPRYRCTATNCDREVFAHNTDRLARRGWSTTGKIVIRPSDPHAVRLLRRPHRPQCAGQPAQPHARR